MRLFSSFPSKREIDIIFQKIMKYSAELKNIIIVENCVDYSKVDVNSLEYLAILYDLKIYMEVMKVKYSNTYIEAVVRNILFSLEDIQIRNGNKIKKNYLVNLFKNMSKYLNELAKVAVQNGEDVMLITAAHLCEEELLMTQNDFEEHSDMIIRIAEHFNEIINLSENEI